VAGVRNETEDFIMGTVPENVTPEKWVNLEDIAIHLSMSEDTVRTWVKEGKLPFYRVGKRYKFKISEVDDWIRTGKIKE
jgi:excisionase family DNA binding protein